MILILNKSNYGSITWSKVPGPVDLTEISFLIWSFFVKDLKICCVRVDHNLIVDILVENLSAKFYTISPCNVDLYLL